MQKLIVSSAAKSWSEMPGAANGKGVWRIFKSITSSPAVDWDGAAENLIALCAPCYQAPIGNLRRVFCPKAGLRQSARADTSVPF
jgi:hypothetical protein